MKRFHIHVGVADLDKNISFYSSLFGQSPAVVKDDYAKWMLDDPRVNFAISSRGLPDGVDHLGFQTDTSEELSLLRAQTARADIATREDGVVSCCYAKSDKYWLTDPQGIAWETFHTLNDIPTFAGPKEKTEGGPACCAPSAKPAAGKPVNQSACC